MAAPKTFAEKMLASTDKIVCPVCNSDISMVRLVNTVRSEKTDAWKFTDGMTKVCKCNEKEVYS